MIGQGIINRLVSIEDCLDVYIQENDYYIFYDYTIKGAENIDRGKYKVSKDTLEKLKKISTKYKSYYITITEIEEGVYKFNYLSSKAKHHRYTGDVIRKTKKKHEDDDENKEVKKSGEDLRDYGYQLLVVN